MKALHKVYLKISNNSIIVSGKVFENICLCRAEMKEIVQFCM